MKNIGIVQFPGTNCDRDVFQFAKAKAFEARYLWHQDQSDLKDFEAVILPGGFSYGDYLRSGALAAKAPIMNSVRDYARRGGRILGICNGFQILTESGLLPGALVKNQGLRFVDDWVSLQFENASPFWCVSSPRQLRLPVAHGDGRFYAPALELQRIEDQGQVWMRYLQNPNASLNDIAGVMNLEKNIVGLMPHPERAIANWMGSMDGWDFL